MIMTRTKKGYNITAIEKDGRELVMEMMRASIQVVQDLSYEYEKNPEEVLRDIGSELLERMSEEEVNLN